MKLADLIDKTISVTNTSVEYLVTYDSLYDYRADDPDSIETLIAFTTDYKCEIILNGDILNAEITEIAAIGINKFLIRIKENK